MAVWSSGSMLNGQSLFSWIEIKFRESVLSSGSFLSFQSLFSGLKEAVLRLFSLVVACPSLDPWLKVSEVRLFSQVVAF